MALAARGRRRLRRPWGSTSPPHQFGDQAPPPPCVRDLPQRASDSRLVGAFPPTCTTSGELTDRRDLADPSMVELHPIATLNTGRTQPRRRTPTPQMPSLRGARQALLRARRPWARLVLVSRPASSRKWRRARPVGDPAMSRQASRWRLRSSLSELTVDR
jgi:hypothetical protein